MISSLLFSEETDDDIENNLASVQSLVPFLFDLAKFSPQPSGEAVRSVLQEKFDDFCKMPKTYPELDSVSKFRIQFMAQLKVRSNFSYPPKKQTIFLRISTLASKMGKKVNP